MNEGRPGVRLECPKSLLDISISAETTRGPHSLLGAGPWSYGADTARGHGVQECLIAATRPSTRHKYLNLTNYLGVWELFAGLHQQHSEMWQPLTGLMVFDIFVTLEGFMLICSHSNSLICCEVFSLNKDTQQLEVVKIQKCFHGLSRIFTMINSEFVVIPHFFYSAHDVIQLNILIYFIV